MKLLNGENKPSLLNNPFNESCVKNIFFHVRKSQLTNEFQSTASVEFQNGNTGGEQKFKAETFADLVKQVEDFIKTL